jgi:hypothetical protein
VIVEDELGDVHARFFPLLGEDLFCAATAPASGYGQRLAQVAVAQVRSRFSP